MIEVNNPEINVDELMDQVRQEIAQRGSFPMHENLSSYNLSLSNTMRISNIEALVNDAESKLSVRTSWPEKYNRFPFKLSEKFEKLALKVLKILFRDQRELNLSIVQALREFLLLNRQLIEQTATLQAQISATDTRLQAMEERLSTTDTRFQAMEDRLSTTDTRLQAMEDRLSTTDTRLQAMEDRLSTTDTRLQAMEERLSTTDTRLQAMEERLSTIDERHVRNDSYLKNDLAQQKRLITLFLEKARQRLPEHFNQDQLQTFINEDKHLLDAFYVALEDKFRGSRKDIINRLKVYLPLLEEAKVGKQDSPILDVGCGRGEWLELLHQTGYIAQGLDINRAMIGQCRSRGFQVIEADVISYLQFLPDASLGAVTGFHIIEHLQFTVLMRLLNEIVRVIKPGGLVIFETPNPQNVLVGTNNFYIDPTHLNPLPSPLSKFLMEHAGLYPVEIMNLNPYEDSFRVSGAEMAATFNNYFYGPQDYAVIGHKI